MRRLIETNLFGPVFTTQAVLPGMRARRSGLIINLTSAAGQAAVPSGGIYSASKFGLEGASEGLLVEVAEFGINTLIVQPGSFKTNFLDNQTLGCDEKDIHVDYVNGATGKMMHALRTGEGIPVAHPAGAAERIVEFAIGEGLGGELKGKGTRMVLGDDAWTWLTGKTQKLVEDVKMSEKVAKSTADGNGQKAMYL